ncbi:MAG: Nramp family divalent metal transporter [Candidatus Pacebacteria bacterium]|nr:Nramp family divalent metal transporter [Candidatus Paceibacterota bacterium]MDR3583054.1 Nramp family divalent metal transporter [Candidatus Paceibacterota bacterium]
MDNLPTNTTGDPTAKKENFFTLSQMRRELDIPLIVAKKLIVTGQVRAIRTVDGTLRVAESEILGVKELIEHPWEKTKLFFRALGPGLITGASDDDPGGIGTYSSVGAQFGLGLLWMAAWLLPMMLAIQEVCARIGIITNQGLAGVLEKHYRKTIVMSAVILLIIANVVNIGADLGAMAASLQMLTGINFIVGAVFFALISIIVEVKVGYHVYVKFLKWLTVSVLAYVVAGFIIHPQWLSIFRRAFVPQINFSSAYVFGIIAVFGTSITPYLFFWQTSEEVEENKIGHKFYFKNKNKIHDRISRMRTDVKAGMLLANIVFFFIVVTTAQTLFNHGITTIGSAQEAALALKPLAGQYAFLLFAAGIIGTGLLAVPILAGSGAYALAEIMKWQEGLELKYSQAKGFYAVIILSILVGLGLNFIGVNPIMALYYSAYLNGIIALPLLIVIMIVGNDKNIMGAETHPGWVKFFGWLAVVFMALAVAVSIYLGLF